MSGPRSSPPKQHSNVYVANVYVDGRRGWRLFFFSFGVACILGLSFRLYFNPDRIQKWIEESIAAHGTSFGLSFKSARLQLARGAWPLFAVEMTGVEAGPARACRPDEIPIRISHLRVPLRVTSLLFGRLTVGTVSGENLFIDLDQLKNRCPGQASRGSATPPSTKPREPAASPDVTAPEKAGVAQPWWTERELGAIEKVVGGFRFSDVELDFENKTKKVLLGRVELKPGEAAGSVEVAAEINLPPELTYGERLPTLSLEAVALPASADVTVTAGMSEGALQADAKLKPAHGGGLDIDARASLDGVPLSTLVPLITKSGVVKGAFRPRFMWMNCEASIRGRFQMLFADNPLTLERCEIEGNGAKISIAKAVRYPDGHWDPFHVEFAHVALGQIMETFDFSFADGILADFGRLSGKLEMSSAAQGAFLGDVEGTQVRFSNHSVRALQKITKLPLKAEWRDGRIEGEIPAAEIEGGAFDGQARFEFDSRHGEGSASIAIRALKLSSAVENLWLGGPLDGFHGKAEARFKDHKLSLFKSRFQLDGLHGSDLKFATAQTVAELEPDGRVALTVHAPELGINEKSWLFQNARPLFFAHRFAGEWIAARDVSIRARFGSEGGFRWDSAQALLAGGKVRISSSGGCTRERDLGGAIFVDYPAVKRLKWRLAGTMEQPILNEDSSAISELKSRGEIDDRALGLPVGADDRGDGLSLSKAVKAVRSGEQNLKALGEKVIQKAKGIMPLRALKPEVKVPADVSSSPEAASREAGASAAVENRDAVAPPSTENPAVAN